MQAPEPMQHSIVHITGSTVLNIFVKSQLLLKKLPKNDRQCAQKSAAAWMVATAKLAGGTPISVVVLFGAYFQANSATLSLRISADFLV
jgi:hypothetical protein